MIVRTKANSLLDQLVKSTSGNNTTYYYVGLGTDATIPTPDGNGFTEPVIPPGAQDDDGNPITTNEYQRVSLEDVISTAQNAIIKNKDIIFFNEAEHYGWGTIKYFGIFTAKTGGKPIFYGELTTPVQIPQNYIPIFRKEKLQIGLDQDPANPATP